MDTCNWTVYVTLPVAAITAFVHDFGHSLVNLDNSRTLMDSGGSRAQSFKPEGGLSEWASKVKDMHSQVDPNEEADQKRLEDEIAASRLARLRRSQISGSRTNSLDLCGSLKRYCNEWRFTFNSEAQGVLVRSSRYNLRG